MRRATLERLLQRFAEPLHWTVRFTQRRTRGRKRTWLDSKRLCIVAAEEVKERIRLSAVVRNSIKAPPLFICESQLT